MTTPGTDLGEDAAVDSTAIRTAFDDAFDQALVFHGFTDYMRNYDLYIYATADPRTGIRPQHLRYRFTHCVRAAITSAVPPQVWRESLDERLVGRDRSDEVDGYVWGVRWQVLYPGISLREDSAQASRWSRDLHLPFHEAVVDTNGHAIALVFSDLVIDALDAG
jgi:hypothetical protein